MTGAAVRITHQTTEPNSQRRDVELAKLWLCDDLDHEDCYGPHHSHLAFLAESVRRHPLATCDCWRCAVVRLMTGWWRTH